MNTNKRLSTAFNYLRNQGIIHTQKDLATIMGASAPNVSNAIKGNKRFLTNNFLLRFNQAVNNVFNTDWLLTGEGEMLANHAANVNANGTNATAINGNYNNVNNGATAGAVSVPTNSKPIVPKYLASQPDTDVYEVVINDSHSLQLETLTTIPPFKDFDFYYQVRQDAMQPEYLQGDVLALVHLKKGAEIIQGAAMVVDTKDFGFLLRRVYDRGDAYECKIINETSPFETQTISKEQVIRLYRILYSIRLGD